jgi:hypothetical protein
MDAKMKRGWLDVGFAHSYKKDCEYEECCFVIVFGFY